MPRLRRRGTGLGRQRVALVGRTTSGRLRRLVGDCVRPWRKSRCGGGVDSCDCASFWGRTPPVHSPELTTAKSPPLKLRIETSIETRITRLLLQYHPVPGGRVTKRGSCGLRLAKVPTFAAGPQRPGAGLGKGEPLPQTSTDDRELQEGTMAPCSSSLTVRSCSEPSTAITHARAVVASEFGRGQDRHA